GLAEANVAADQAVHWFWPFHVSFCFNDGAHLVGSFFVNKGALELTLPRSVGSKRMARLGLARGLNGEEIAGHVAHGSLGLGLGLDPARAPEGIERWVRLAGAGVFADQMGLGDR